MKANKPFENDEALSKLLGTWKIEAHLPPRFQESVWQRIQRAEPGVTASFWLVLTARIEAAFLRPAFAAVYIALFMFAGLGVGYWHAEDRTAHAESGLRSRYVQSVDPYQMPR